MPQGPDTPSPAALARIVSLVLAVALATGPMTGKASTPPSPQDAPTLRSQVESQPYRIGDWADFQPVAVTDLGILLLGDGPDAGAEDADIRAPMLTVAVSGPSPLPARRDAFARLGLELIPFVLEVEAESAQTVRHGTVEWYEMVGRGRSVSGRPVVVFQSFWFGVPGGPYVRLVGTAPEEMRDAVLPRFRRVARSLTLKEGSMGRRP